MLRLLGGLHIRALRRHGSGQHLPVPPQARRVDEPSVVTQVHQHRPILRSAVDHLAADRRKRALVANRSQYHIVPVIRPQRVSLRAITGLKLRHGLGDAAAESEHMLAGGRGGPSPRESGVVLAPGLGLTNRVIIDQHFNRRGRMGRLLAALSFNPFVCGLGIDENTAGFIAPDGTMEVVGHGTVTVVDPADLRHSSMSYVRKAEAVSLIGLKLHVLAHGSQFNLETREAKL